MVFCCGIVTLENVGTVVNYHSIFIALVPRATIWAQCYKTFYGCNLRMFVVSYSVFVLGKSCQPSLMFVGKAGAYPIEEPFRCSTIG